MSSADTREIWLPEKFWSDHVDRDLPAGTLVRKAGKRVLVRVTPDELAEIRDDASHYADPAGPDDYDGRAAMVRSAKATVRAIDNESRSAPSLPVDGKTGATIPRVPSANNEAKP